MRIFHIVDRAVWAKAVDTGEYLPGAFQRDGFVHCAFADQVTGVANALYRNEVDLIVAEIDSDTVPGEMRVEDSDDLGVQYPHVYGPIPARATVRVHEMARADNGDWVFNPDAADDASSTDR